MKLYYVDQRKVFPFLQPVEVWDEQGNVRYRLKSKSTVGLQLHLLTPYDEEVASIRQKVSLGSEYIANVNGKELTVTRKATFLKGERFFQISALNWKAEDFSVYHTYRITAEDQQIAQVRMVEFFKGHKNALYEALKKIAQVPRSELDQANCCEVEFSDDQNEAEVLAVVMAIEASLSNGGG